MSGMAGLLNRDSRAEVEVMLDRIRHRGPDGRTIIALGSGVLGAVRLKISPFDSPGPLTRNGTTVVWDGEIYDPDVLKDACGSAASDAAGLILDLYGKEGPDFLSRMNGPFALAILDRDNLLLARDPLGQAPLYYGTAGGRTCFASEIKAIQAVADDIRIFPPGHFLWRGEIQPIPFREAPIATGDDPEPAAAELRLRLEKSIERRLKDAPRIGVWLSGGLDSSVLAALAASASQNVSTFSAGVKGASDLAFAEDVAAYLGTDHHVRLCTTEEMLEVLPRVIYHLESFDAPLVRSSIANFLVAEEAARHVRVVLSGEGADELFGGYGYLKDKSDDDLRAALGEAQSGLHNTALQRVDRMAAAHGTRARPGFLDADVVALANAMPGALKIHGPDRVEKWILRKSIEGRLPESVVWRPKEKFWSGSGISGTIADIADREIGDDAFHREREIGPGFVLGSKEDLYYWRIFRRFFPGANVLDGQGRTVHRESR